MLELSEFIQRESAPEYSGEYNAESAPESLLFDAFGRRISYLRVSVTDRCNQHCSYCTTPLATHKKRADILSLDEIGRLVRIMSGMGVEKVRLTGGEPLVRKDVDKLIVMLKEISSIKDLAMTTNAILLGRYARVLKESGLDRLNISLDTLNPASFRKITGGGELSRVLEGIDAAIEERITPLKINTVIMRGANEDELAGIIDFAEEKGATVRFIESMPMSDALDWKKIYMPVSEVLERGDIRARVDVSAVPVKGATAAYILPLKSGKGKVGFVSPMSNRFCDNCNRLRLTSDGRLRSCLPSDNDIDLRPALKSCAGDAEIISLIREAVLLKPEVGEYNFDGEARKKSMIHIGG